MNPRGHLVQEESRRLDRDTISRIRELVAEQHRLREHILIAHPLTPDELHRLAQLQTQLDELWSVVRQRRSGRYFGNDPDTVSSSPT